MVVSAIIMVVVYSSAEKAITKNAQNMNNSIRSGSLAAEINWVHVRGLS